jgi:hypothetical protein
MLVFCEYCYCIVDSANFVLKNRYCTHKKYACCSNGKPVAVRNGRKKEIKPYSPKKISTATQTIQDIHILEEYQYHDNNMSADCKLLLELSKQTVQSIDHNFNS